MIKSMCSHGNMDVKLYWVFVWDHGMVEVIVWYYYCYYYVPSDGATLVIFCVKISSLFKTDQNIELQAVTNWKVKKFSIEYIVIAQILVHSFEAEMYVNLKKKRWGKDTATLAKRLICAQYRKAKNYQKYPNKGFLKVCQLYIKRVPLNWIWSSNFQYMGF